MLHVKMGSRPWETKDLVLMKERPLFTAALVFSSPSLVPSLAAFMSFCICKTEARNKELLRWPSTTSPAVTLKEYCQVVRVDTLCGVSIPVWERLFGYGQCVCVCGSKKLLICFFLSVLWLLRKSPSLAWFKNIPAIFFISISF